MNNFTTGLTDTVVIPKPYQVASGIVVVQCFSLQIVLVFDRFWQFGGFIFFNATSYVPGGGTPMPTPTLSEAAVAEAQLASILITNVIILTVSLTFFMGCYRRLKNIYMPLTNPVYWQDMPEKEGDWAGNEKIALPQPGVFGWVISTWRYPLKRMVNSHGLDAAIVICYLQSVLKIFIVTCLYSVLVLVPVQLSSTVEPPKEGLIRLQLSNM